MLQIVGQKEGEEKSDDLTQLMSKAGPTLKFRLRFQSFLLPNCICLISDHIFFILTLFDLIVMVHGMCAHVDV